MQDGYKYGIFFVIFNIMKFALFRCFLAVTLTLASSLLCCSQLKDNDIKFRLAQSYERGGDIESALKIYSELYAKDSTNVVYFEALRRDYLQLKRYDDVIALFQRAVALRAMPVQHRLHAARPEGWGVGGWRRRGGQNEAGE